MIHEPEPPQPITEFQFLIQMLMDKNDKQYQQFLKDADLKIVGADATMMPFWSKETDSPYYVLYPEKFNHVRDVSPGKYHISIFDSEFNEGKMHITRDAQRDHLFLKWNPKYDDWSIDGYSPGIMLQQYRNAGYTTLDMEYQFIHNDNGEIPLLIKKFNQLIKILRHYMSQTDTYIPPHTSMNISGGENDYWQKKYLKYKCKYLNITKKIEKGNL
jgi:hypothetical protein